MDLNFYKIQSFANDIVLINGITQPLPEKRLFPYLARLICSRHRGVGANGLLLLLPGKKEKIYIEYYNPAGFLLENYNDSYLCLGRYLFDSGLFNENDIYIENKTGKRKISNIDSDTFRIEMPQAKYVNSDEIIKQNLEDNYNSTIYINKKKYTASVLNIQENAFVFFQDDIKDNEKKNIIKAVKNNNEIKKAECIFASNYSNDLLLVKHKPDKLKVDFSRSAAMAFIASVLNNFTDREAVVKINNSDAYLDWDFKTNKLSLAGKSEYLFSGIYYFQDQDI